MASISVILVLAAVLGIWFAFSVARRVREWLEGEGKEKRAESWFSQFEGILWILGVGIGALKYLYKAWKSAPAGSAEKLVWGLLIAFVAALALFVALRIVDSKVNAGSSQGAIGENENREQSW